MTLPVVTIVIPARNEENDIERCLRAVLVQDYPAELLEVIVVDGASTDRTAEFANRLLDGKALKHAAVISNPTATTPSNLNAGLAAASGDVVCRVDARSIIPPHYVRTCAAVLVDRADVAVVGGAQVAVAIERGPVATGIARALNNRYGMGLARYRRGATSGRADTVYLGAFRTAQLRDAGGWDERFGTNQDFELNRRMTRFGRVWFDARLRVGYVPRRSLGDLFSQYRRFGVAKARYWRTTGDPPQPRQLAILALPFVGMTACAAAVLVRPLRRPLVVAALAGPVAMDVAGNRERAPASAHVVGVAASAAVAGGWLIGVWTELLRHRDR